MEAGRQGGVLEEIARTLAAYIGGQVVVALICTVVYLAAFALLGVPLWFLVGLVSGFLHLIPQFGAPLTLLIGLGVSFVGGMGWERLLGVLGVYVFVFTLEGFWLSPKIIGNRVRVRPLWVFLAVPAGGLLFGLPGLLLAVPVLAVAAIVYRRARPGR